MWRTGPEQCEIAKIVGICVTCCDYVIPAICSCGQLALGAVVFVGFSQALYANEGNIQVMQ